MGICVSTYKFDEEEKKLRNGQRRISSSRLKVKSQQESNKKLKILEPSRSEKRLTTTNIVVKGNSIARKSQKVVNESEYLRELKSKLKGESSEKNPHIKEVKEFIIDSADDNSMAEDSLTNNNFKPHAHNIHNNAAQTDRSNKTEDEGGIFKFKENHTDNLSINDENGKNSLQASLKKQEVSSKTKTQGQIEENSNTKEVKKPNINQFNLEVIVEEEEKIKKKKVKEEKERKERERIEREKLERQRKEEEDRIKREEIEREREKQLQLAKEKEEKENEEENVDSDDNLEDDFMDMDNKKPDILLPNAQHNLDNHLKDKDNNLEYKNIFSETDKPEDFNSKYTITSILKDSENKVVYKIQNKETLMYLKLLKTKKTEKSVNYFIPEVNSNINIEHSLDVYNNKDNISVVQNLRKDSSLESIIESLNSEENILYIIFQIVYSVSHLHRQGIMCNKLSVDSFNVIGNYKNKYFNISLSEYNFYSQPELTQNKQKWDFFDIAIIFYYLVMKRYPTENLEKIKIQLENKLSKYSLSLISKLSDTNLEIEMRKLMDHRSFNNYDINLSTVNILNNHLLLSDYLKKLEANIENSIKDKNFNSTPMKNAKSEAGVNFFCKKILLLKSESIEEEKHLDLINQQDKKGIDYLSRLVQENLEIIVSQITSLSAKQFFYDFNFIGKTIRENIDLISDNEELIQIIIRALR